jgi:hypothetical protein
MSPAIGRVGRLAAELAVVALAVSGVAIATVYAQEGRFFDYPGRGENAWRNFVSGSIALSVLGTAAAWAVWLTWRYRARVAAQPDGPARLLAVAVATLPGDRREWGAALTAELASLTARPERWHFAVSGARAALVSPAGARRPAAGWVGGTIGVVGVVACAAAAVHILATAASSSPAYAVPARGWDYVVDENLVSAVALVVVLVACLAVIVAAPASLTSSRLARRTGTGVGLVAGSLLLVSSSTGDFEVGAMGHVLSLQLLVFVVAPAVVAVVTRSLRAALQCTVWGFVFTAVTMFPVYVLESIGKYEASGLLLLDDDPPLPGATVATNLGDAVGWLLLVVPGLLVSFGVLVAAVLATIARAVAPPAIGR